MPSKVGILSIVSDGLEICDKCVFYSQEKKVACNFTFFIEVKLHMFLSMTSNYDCTLTRDTVQSSLKPTLSENVRLEDSDPTYLSVT